VSLEERARELLAKGDVRGAATAVIQELGPVVLSYLRPALRDDDEVADAFARWAENVWKGLPSFEWRSTLKTWAIRLACNVALNERDRAHWRRERRFLTGEASALANSVRTTSAVRVERQRRVVLELRKGLSPEQQTLLFLRVDQELPWEDIAEILSAAGKRVDANTVSKRFERLKTRLRQLAREKGLLE
jgi:RNA polymerase sigma-70 factor (ECF subfamily)